MMHDMRRMMGGMHGSMALVWVLRLLRTGGPEMLRMMNWPTHIEHAH
jgi:hypothetical protein